VSDIQRQQAVLDSIKENDFHDAFEVWKNDGIAVYVPKEAILKEMTAKIELVKPEFLFSFFFFYLVRELSDRTS
jgi:spore maturation protein CgeB